MNREFFNQQFAALIAAFTSAQKLPDVTQDVYWEVLQDIPEDKFAHGMRQCLAACKFFPTIAELGDASMPAVTDYRAPLPPIDRERPMINWQTQIEREKRKRLQVDGQSQRRIEPA